MIRSFTIPAANGYVSVGETPSRTDIVLTVRDADGVSSIHLDRYQFADLCELNTKEMFIDG